MSRKTRTENFQKNFLIPALSAIVVLLAILVIIVYRQNNPSSLARITINGNVFHAEVADTDESRRIGLMYRKSLPERQGMLFIFDQPEIQYFWMRNTYIPLDIIFIDDQLRIINISTMPPLTDEACQSTRPALYVLELQAGSAKKYDLKPNQEVVIKLPKKR